MSWFKQNAIAAVGMLVAVVAFAFTNFPTYKYVDDRVGSIEKRQDRQSEYMKQEFHDIKDLLHTLIKRGSNNEN